jgi:hypothetical protein
VAGASKENPIDVDALLPTEFISSEDDDFVGQSSGDSVHYILILLTGARRGLRQSI